MNDSIPPIFHSVEHDAPFSACCRCEQPLDSLPYPHIISKQFERGECVLEFAICQPCYLQVGNEMSRESKDAAKNYIEERVDLDQRSAALGESPAEDWIRSCLACGATPAARDSFSLGGMAFGGSFLLDPYPMLTCGDCQQAIEERLSKQTKDRWDRFIGDHFEGPPADAQTPPRRTPVLI